MQPAGSTDTLSEPTSVGTIESQAKGDAEVGEADFKQHAKGIVELHGQIIDCKSDNILHGVKITPRQGLNFGKDATHRLIGAKLNALVLRYSRLIKRWPF